MPVYTPKELLEKYRYLNAEQQQQVAQLLERFRGHAPDSSSSTSPHTHRAVGRLLFAGGTKPLHHMIVELWDREFLHPDQILGRGLTDGDGRFTVPYSPAAEGRKGELRLDLRILDTDFVCSDAGEVVEKGHLIHHVEHNQPISQAVHDFGTIEVPYFEYERESPMVRARTVEGGEPVEPFTKGRTAMVHKLISELALRRTTHQLASRINPNWPSLTQIQKDYPENRTRRLEKERPGWTRSDEYLGERALNGMHPLLFSRERSNPNRYRVWWNWDACEMNGRYDLPNTDARFEVRDGKLWPVQITLQFRVEGGTAPHSPMRASVTFTPADGDRWEQAKRVFRVVSGVAGETDVHMSQTHLNGEQYAIACHRNLRRNPVRFLLFPHLREVIPLNWRADRLVIGKSGILTRASGLSAAGAVSRMAEQMSRHDWKGWRPRQPITPGHTFARAGLLFWEVLTDHIEAFFAANLDGIIRYWPEVHRFARDLVENSVPYSPALPDAEDDWFDTGELDKPEIPRTEFGGTVRAVRPITWSDQPSDAEIQNLKDACRYIIYQTTYVHSYFNERQYDDGGELMYASLGLRNGSLGAESDLTVAPRPTEATDTLFLARYLSALRYGMILKNEDHDVPPGLIRLLRTRQEAFAAVGFEIAEIASRTNI